MQNLLSSTNYTFTISFTSALILETLSSLQSLHIIFQTLSQSTSKFQTVFQTLYKHLPFFTEAYKLDNSSPLSSLYLPIYTVIVAYFALHLCLLGLVLICVYFQKHKSYKKLQKILNTVYLLHSRILFFPVQFFLLGLLHMGAIAETSQIYASVGFKIVVILLSVLNFGLALIKDFLLKSIPQSKNAYSLKTNSYHQAILTHKALALLLYYLSFYKLNLATRLSSVLHLFQGVFSVYILYRKLPFYNFQLLKLGVITSSLKLSLGIICILQVCITGLEAKNSLQILFLLLPVLIIKISLGLFQRLFTQILQGGDLKSPEDIIHYAFLLKKFAFDDHNKAFLDQSFYPTKSAFMGALSEIQDLENIRNKVTRKKYQYQLYESILEHIKKAHPRNLESSMMIIFMAHIYLTKLDNIVKAMKMIKRLENKRSSSLYHKTLIDHFYLKLDKAYAAQDDEQQKELAGSLKEFEAVTILKRNILQETKRQIAFWEIMKGPNIDIQRVYELGKEIELMANKIKKQYDDFGFNSGSNKISLTSGLIYAVYLKMVRHLPHQGAKLLRRMHAILFSQDFKDDLDIQQQTGAQTVLVLSLSKSKIGKVVEVSGPLETVFGFKKRDIIGQKFGILFPKFIAKNLHSFLQKYAHDPKYKLNNKYPLYGRTKDNELFELEAHLQLFPYLNRKITVMMTLKKTSYQQSIMIVDHNGQIVECSESLRQAFENQKVNVSNIKYLRDLSPELDQANKAYNLISQQQQQSEYDDGELASTARRQNPSSSEKLDELMTSPRWRNNSMHSKLLSATNVDWMFSDGNQDGNSTSRSRQFDNIKTLRIQSVAPNTLTLSAFNKMSLEEAQQLCSSFEAGRRVIFSSKASSSSSSSSNMNIKPLANVRISLLPLCDSSFIFKVIHIPQVYSEQVTILFPTKAQDQLQPVSPMSPIRLLSSERKLFETEAEIESPVGNEFHFTETKNSLNFPKIPSAFKFFNFKEQLATTERTLSPSTKRVTFPSLTKEQEIDPLHTDSKDLIPSGKNTTPIPENGDIKDGFRDGIASSIKNSSYKEIRAMEMLNSIGTNKKPHNLYYYFQFLVFIVIILMIILVSINFYFSRKSISEIEDGVNIVAVATWRITALLQLWQRYLGIPSLVQMGTPDTLYVAELWKGLIPGNIQTLVSVNNEMKQQVANANEKSELLKDIFEKNIEFWVESETGEKESQMFDIFTANDVLVSRLLAIKNFSFADPSVIYILNNTANDYFLASDRLATNAGTYLQTTINGNLTRLKAILAVECIILAVLSIILITMPMGTMKVYRDLFNTLSQIDETLILAQIEPLKSTQYLLEGEIDAKSFVIDALNIFGDDKSKSTVFHQNRKRNREERVLNFKSLKISLVKNTLLGLLFIPLFAGIFSDTLIQSNNTFQELQTMTQQIVLASKVSSVTLLSLSTLDYERVFYNRTDMLLIGTSPRIFVYEILAILDELNKELPEKFLYKSGSDKVIQRIFQDDVCSFVSDDVLDSCLISSQETKMNLLSLGSQYLQIMTYYTALFNSNPTESHGLEAFIVASRAASNPSATLQNIYNKIMMELLDDIMGLIDGIDGKVEKNSIVLWVIIVFCGVFVKWYTMRKLLEYDIGRRKILRIIPLSIIQNDKGLKFYFRRSFPKEVKGAREFLM